MVPLSVVFPTFFLSRDSGLKDRLLLGCSAATVFAELLLLVCQTYTEEKNQMSSAPASMSAFLFMLGNNNFIY